MSNLMPVAQIVAALRRHAISRVPWIFAGADMGVRGGILILAWLSFASRLRGDFWWASCNLAGSAVYGDQVYRMGLGRATLAGAAVLLCLYAVLGILFSLVVPAGAGHFRALVLGVAAAAVWHSASESFIGEWISRDFFLYTNSWALMFANILFGLCLGWVPRRRIGIGRLFDESPGPDRQPLQMPAPDSGESGAPEDC
jgi:hypothetical protein